MNIVITLQVHKVYRQFKVYIAIIAKVFITSLIETYSIYHDKFRTWFIKGSFVSDKQKKNYHTLYGNIMENTTKLNPGVSFKALSFNKYRLKR